MHKKPIQIKINQSINYQESGDSENWNYSCQGELTQFMTFSKINFTDQNGEDIELKWSPKKMLLELNRKSGVLRFKNGSLLNYYHQTPIANFDLLVKTDDLIFDLDKGYIKIDYQIIQDEKALGDYKLELIYSW